MCSSLSRTPTPGKAVQAALSSHALLQFSQMRSPYRGSCFSTAALECTATHAACMLTPAAACFWKTSQPCQAGELAPSSQPRERATHAQDTILPHQPPGMQSCSRPDSDSCMLRQAFQCVDAAANGCLPVCRLWRSLAEHALSVRDFAIADKAFVRCADFQVGQLLLYLTQAGEADTSLF